MSSNPIYPFSLRQRLSEAGKFSRFAFRTLIAPWPPYAVIMGIVVGAGAVVPLLNIKATAGLIDALTATDASPEQPLLALLEPYAPWLLLVGTMIAHHILFMASFQHYLTAQLNERVRERFDR